MQRLSQTQGTANPSAMRSVSGIFYVQGVAYMPAVYQSRELSVMGNSVPCVGLRRGQDGTPLFFVPQSLKLHKMKKLKSKGTYPPVVGFSECDYSTALNLEGEEWKTIPVKELCGYYEASNFGRLRSKERIIGNRHYNPMILKCRTNKDGYLRICFKRHGSYFVHRLIAYAWFGVSSMSIDHINGKKQDNRVCNLEYVTHFENMRRAVANGLIDYKAIGRFNSNRLRSLGVTKLSNEQVLNIRQKYTSNNISVKDLAITYNCSVTTIYEAIRGEKAYKNI